MARCNQTKENFGIRLEEMQTGQWIATWAFAVKDTYAKKEQYDKNTVTGTFTFASAYPGCPYCAAKSIFQGSCGEVNCWDGTAMLVTCAWCGQTNKVGGQIEALSVKGDY